MPALTKIKGVENLVAKLRARAARAMRDTQASVLVGYSANYALWVHENMEQKLKGQPRPSGIATYWSPAGTGPKFLERPARELGKPGGVLAQIIRKAFQSGKATMAQALVMAGLRLQRESQMLVPVEFGVLRASAFTRLEGSNGGSR
jgi:hypothetical protein